MKGHAPRAIVVCLGLAALAATLSAQQQELPRFRSSVEVTSMDVSVYDDRGRPIDDLKPQEFNVRVDGTARRVVTAEWIPLEAPMGPVAPAAPEGYSSNESATGGRLILLVIDQPNIRFGGTFGIRKAMYAFIDRLQPSDRAAVVGIGIGSPSTSFTADHDRLKKAIDGMVGQHHQMTMSLHGIGLAEAIRIGQQVPGALDEAVSRECRDSAGRMMQGPDLDICVFEVDHEAQDMARDSINDGLTTIATLRALLVALKAIDAPKTLLLVSEGFVTQDHGNEVLELGSLSAAARTSIYALKLDDQLFALAASEARAPISSMDDRYARAEGLETLVGASRGSLFNIIGTGQGAFERIESELSGYYLIGVESGSADKDGKAHPIRIDVTRKGLTVRARRAVMALPAASRPRNARESVMAGLSTPLPISALPLRIATYSMQGPQADKVQILIHADIGTDYPSSRVVALGYVITDNEGRMVENQAATARLPPVMAGVPSSLQYSSLAVLPPGDYLLKLAVAEGDRLGTVEHSIHAGVKPVGALRFSDLMVGGPLATGEELLQPTIGYSVVFGAVHGYLEAYGEGASDLSARYEIVPEDQSAPLLDADVLPRMAGRSRAIFTRVMTARQLPPGRYLLRVTLSSAGMPVNVTLRPFEVAPPAVLMTSASTSNAMLTMNEVYLPVTDQMFLHEFNRSEVARPAVVRVFRDRVPPAAQASFDRGVQALANGSLGEAEASFKSAIDPDQDSSAVITYLGAVFAAGGRDSDAAGAWQTALIDEGSETPEVYDWLIGSLMRSHDLATARSFLEEAITKWPSDARFAKPMSLIYATFGQGIQAVRSLQRHLAEHGDDVEGLFMGVEWIYQLRSAGASAQSPAEDVRLAKTYADAYLKAKGPQSALVKQWIAYLDNKK